MKGKNNTFVVTLMAMATVCSGIVARCRVTTFTFTYFSFVQSFSHRGIWFSSFDSFYLCFLI